MNGMSQGNEDDDDAADFHARLYDALETHTHHTRLESPIDVEDDDDETYCERKPLLNGVARSHSRTGHGPFSGLSRSNSVPSVSGRSDGGESIRKLTSAQKKTILFTAVADLLAYLSLSIMAPFFPEEALKKGISDTLSGWIFGTQPFVQFLISPMFGKLIPYAGVKFTFLSGQFLSGGCTVLFGLLTYIQTAETGDSGFISFVVLSFLLQIMKSVGTCATSTASFVYLAQEFDNIATVFGIGEIFVGLGLVVGPAVGGLLYGRGGFMLPFTVIGGLSLVVIPFMWWIIPTEVMYDDKNSEKIPFSKVLRSPKAIVTSLAIVVSTFSWSILDPTLEPHLRQFKLSPELIGVIFLVMAAAYAVSSPIWGWVADKMTDQRGLLVGGFAIACVGSLLIGPSSLIGFDDTYYELWLIILALVILGASISLSSIPTFNQYFTLFEDLGFEDDTRTYGMVAGLWMSMYSLGVKTRDTLLLEAIICYASIIGHNCFLLEKECLENFNLRAVRDFLGPSVGGFLLDNIGFNDMCNYTAGLCLAMALLVVVSWTVETCCCSKKADTKDIEKVCESFSNKSYGINDTKDMSG